MRFQSGVTPLTLVSHPQTTPQGVRGIEVDVNRAGPDGLSLTFAVQGDLSGLRIPQSRAPRRARDLWRHTCFEAFTMAGQGPGYREFNFSPSGEWAAYEFRGYRDGGDLAVELNPGIEIRRLVDRLELEASIGPAFLPPGGSLRMGLSAVLEGGDGTLSYWALRHPPGKPDFHHTEAFAAQLVVS